MNSQLDMAKEKVLLTLKPTGKLFLKKNKKEILQSLHCQWSKVMVIIPKCKIRRTATKYTQIGQGEGGLWKLIHHISDPDQDTGLPTSVLERLTY